MGHTCGTHGGEETLGKNFARRNWSNRSWRVSAGSRCGPMASLCERSGKTEGYTHAEEYDDSFLGADSLFLSFNYY